MGSTIIPAREGIQIRIENEGDERRYILEVADYDFPEFDLTPLLIHREEMEEQIAQLSAGELHECSR